MNTTTDKVQVGESTTGTSTSTTYKSSSSSIEYGWACPRCGRINAPWKSYCDCSGKAYWYPTWEGPYYDEWWRHVTCAPETTWKTPSSVCGSDSTTSVKSNPNSNIYTTATNPTVGGSDYWNPVTKTWENIPSCVTNTINNKMQELQSQIDSLKETK